ncbi:MAG: hypothetical protein GY730_11855 [bacterium]|nr:hypothetical protein [bacterium]
MLAAELKNTVLGLPLREKVELLCDTLDKPDPAVERKLAEISEKRYQDGEVETSDHANRP